MSLAHIFQPKVSHSSPSLGADHSEKVLRSILNQDEIWYWDPKTNIVDKRASTKRSTKKDKKDNKDKKEKKEKIKKDRREKKEHEKAKKMKKEMHATEHTNRKTLTSSDDICWRKAEINKTLTKRDLITQGTPTDAMEHTLRNNISFTVSDQPIPKINPLHHSISFANEYRISKDSSSSSTTSPDISEGDDSESDDSIHTVPKATINKLRFLSLRQSRQSTSSSTPSSSSSSTATTSTPSSSTTTQDSTLSGSTCSSTTSSATNSPIASPRSPTMTSGPTTTTTSSTSDSPATTPRTNLRMRLHMGLRKSIQNPNTVAILNNPNGHPTLFASPPCSPRLTLVTTNSEQTSSSEEDKAVEEVVSRSDAADNGITPKELVKDRCPTPLALDQALSQNSSDDQLELRSIDELTDDSAGEVTAFWVREKVYCPPSTRIPPTPYFDLILKSFDECL